MGGLAAWRVRLGRKYAVYLPREVVERLGLREGDRLEVRLEDGEIVLRPVPRLLRRRRYWAEIDPGLVEEVGEELSGAAIVEAEDSARY